MPKSSRPKGKGFSRGLEPGWEYARLNNWEYPHRVAPKQTQRKPAQRKSMKQLLKKQGVVFRQTKSESSARSAQKKFYAQQVAMEDQMFEHVHSSYAD